MLSRRGFLLLGLLTVWSVGLSPGLVGAQRDSRFALEPDDSGGYENFLVVIGESVREDPALLERIAYVVTEGSKFLHQATKNQVFFKEVHVLIPESWSDSADYEEAEWQRFDHGDLRVDLPSENNGDTPYVRRVSSCGTPGSFIHLTPNYILSERIAASYGPHGKLFAHEWGHYRWGVFDEYPTNNMSHFYADEEGNIEAVRCVRNIPGRLLIPRTGEPCSINSNGYPEPACRYIDDREATGYTGSLMYKQFLPRITSFCEKESNGVSQANAHNRDAPNRQNVRCNRKSVWEVMLEHRDFAALKEENDVRTPRADDELVPTVKFVKKRPDRLVLVLDVSGSMRGQRLTQLRQAAELLISQILEDGQQLGIVIFAEFASIRSHLLDINPSNRELLLGSVPISATGATSIGSGILDGIDVLKGRDNDQVAAGGQLLVITDGIENRKPYINDTMEFIPELISSGVTVHTIAIGMDASPGLERLATLTGGRTYYHDDQSNFLADAFGRATTVDKETMTVPVSLASEFVQLASGQSYSDVVYVDDSVGRNTQFLFGLSQGAQVDILVTTPDDAFISQGSPGYEAVEGFNQIRFSIPDIAKPGVWKYDIANTGSSSVNVTVLVQSRARQGKDPLAIQTKWGLTTVKPPQKQSLYVTVGKGYTAVVGSEVTASMEMPCGNENRTAALHPKDDGIGADIVKGDGVYSAYFTEFCSEGRYGVSVQVKNKGKDTAVAKGRIVGFGAALDPTLAGDETGSQPTTELVSTGDFRRVTIGESFRCVGSQLCNGSIDVYPPSRIVDLLASPLNIETMEVRLTFTAPGDDLTTGQATRYRIVMARKSDDIFDNFDAAPEIPADSFVQGDVMRPSSSGNTEVFVVRVPEIGKFSYAFAVAAEDDEGNRGDPSNLATSSARDFSRLPLGLIIGVAVGGLVLLVLVVVLVCSVLRRRRGRKGNKAGREAAGGESGAPTGREAVACRSVSEAVSSRENEYENLSPGTATNPAPKPTQKPAPAASPKKGDPPQKALKPPASKPLNGGPLAKRQGGPTPASPAGAVNHGFQAQSNASPVYSEFITRRDRDPNWDPTLPNNREGGGANIKAGLVADTKSKFDQIGLLK